MNPYGRCNTDIVMVKGDTCHRNITIKGADPEIISNVYFTCNKLGISQNLEYDQETQKYILHLDANDTINYKQITTDYDITIEFFDESIRTVVYRGKFVVVDKNNPIER